MIGFLKSLFAAIAGVFKYLGDRQLVEAGKAEQSVEAVKEVEQRVEQAEKAVTVPDASRTERLRNRFGRGETAGSGK